MRKLLYCLALGSFAVVSISCNSAKRFSYQDAYRFSAHDYGKKVEKTSHDVPDEILTAHAKNYIPEGKAQTEAPAIEEERSASADADDFMDKVDDLNEAGKQLADKAFVLKKDPSLSNKERNDLRKEIRRDLRQFKKDAKEVRKEAKAQQQLTGYMRTGAILGGMGLIAMILGSLFGVGALITVGALLVIAGIVFILVDLI